LRCIQAYVNLAESGDDDGGLIVLNKGHEVSKPYHDAVRGLEARQFQHTNEVYAYTQEGVDKMRDMGYGEWIKVNAGPGDIVMWDSRVPHYNVNVGRTVLCSLIPNRLTVLNVSQRATATASPPIPAIISLHSAHRRNLSARRIYSPA
jgi:hypothetical protein